MVHRKPGHHFFLAGSKIKDDNLGSLFPTPALDSLPASTGLFIAD